MRALERKPVNLNPSPAPKPPRPLPNPQSAIRNPQSPAPRPAFPPKTKPVAHPFQTRLWINVGAETGIAPIDVVNTISGETGLPGNVVGTVNIHPRHLFVDVAAEHANVIISKLNRAQIKGHKLKVKAA